jgi:plastocyanin
MSSDLRSGLILTAFLAVATSGAIARAQYAPMPSKPKPKPAPAKPVADKGKPAEPPAPPPGPVTDKAEALRQAADSLDKANAALARGNKSYAEQLFSTAEILTGPEALADVAEVFRAGAPPRVTSPVKTFAADTPAQPKTVGSSEEDEPDKKPEKGSLTGTIEVDGKPPTDSFGVVTLEPKGKKWKARTAKQRVMEQRGREFAPRVMAVSVGSTVSFPNFDTVFHNVFSTSDAAAFDLGLYKTGEAREVTFKKEGVIRLGCNLHANMAAWIVVVSQPHYVITDASGKFEFKTLKPGKYVLKAWNEKSNAPVTQEVEIKAGKNTVTVGVKGDAPAGPMPDKFGVARGKK